MIVGRMVRFMLNGLFVIFLVCWIFLYRFFGVGCVRVVRKLRLLVLVMGVIILV